MPDSKARAAAHNIPRILANALFACGFMTWKRVAGPPLAVEHIQTETFEGKTDDELVAMTDGGIFKLDGKTFTFDPIEVTQWTCMVVKMTQDGAVRYDGAATNLRTGTLIRLGQYAKRAHEIALNGVDDPTERT